MPAEGFTFPGIKFIPCCCGGAVKLVGSRRPVGKVGETQGVFPSLSIGDRACAVRRASAQPTVHKFTASLRHRVTLPLPWLAQACRSRPRPVFATRVPDADGAGCTSRRSRQGCAAARSRCSPDAGRPIRASPSTKAARRRCCRGSALNSGFLFRGPNSHRR